jgi:Ca2+/Na+ antiporter
MLHSWTSVLVMSSQFLFIFFLLNYIYYVFFFFKSTKSKQTNKQTKNQKLSWFLFTQPLFSQSEWKHSSFLVQQMLISFSRKYSSYGLPFWGYLYLSEHSPHSPTLGVPTILQHLHIRMPPASLDKHIKNHGITQYRGMPGPGRGSVWVGKQGGGRV